jgi:hypothetical protein
MGLFCLSTHGTSVKMDPKAATAIACWNGLLLHIVVRDIQKEESIEIARCAEDTPFTVQSRAELVLPRFLRQTPHQDRQDHPRRLFDVVCVLVER